MNEFTLVGTWKCTYTTHNSSEVASSIIIFNQHVEGIIGKSLPQKDETLLTLNLQFDSENNVFTGTWQEVSSIHGKYKGKIFHGALQLIPNVKGDCAEGKWIGFNEDNSKISTGDWKLERVDS